MSHLLAPSKLPPFPRPDFRIACPTNCANRLRRQVLTLCKAVDHRVWPWDPPLLQAINAPQPKHRRGVSAAAAEAAAEAAAAAARVTPQVLAELRAGGAAGARRYLGVSAAASARLAAAAAVLPAVAVEVLHAERSSPTTVRLLVEVAAVVSRPVSGGGGDGGGGWVGREFEAAPEPFAVWVQAPVHRRLPPGTLLARRRVFLLPATARTAGQDSDNHLRFDSESGGVGVVGGVGGGGGVGYGGNRTGFGLKAAAAAVAASVDSLTAAGVLPAAAASATAVLWVTVECDPAVAPVLLVRAISESWLGCEAGSTSAHTDILSLSCSLSFSLSLSLPPSLRRSITPSFGNPSPPSPFLQWACMNPDLFLSLTHTHKPILMPVRSPDCSLNSTTHL
jgi:hypothetical protein